MANDDDGFQLVVFRHNVADLCQPRPSAWVTVATTQTSPKRGGPNLVFTHVDGVFRRVQFGVAPLGL